MSRDNLPPGVLPQDIDGQSMPRCARCSEEVNELNDVGLCEDCDESIEQFAWEAFAYAHPVEAHAYNPDRFWDYFHKQSPDWTREQMLVLLREHG